MAYLIDKPLIYGLYLDVMNHTQAYITALQKEYATGKALEHSYRPALKSYIESLLPDVHAVNEPKRQKCGAPDYVISRTKKGQSIDIGYIEAKEVNIGLDKIEKSDQMKRYLEGLDNLILTDYLEFRFYKNQEKVATIRIAELDDFFTQNPSIKPLPDNFSQLETLLKNFVEYTGQTIKSAKNLAEMMARKAQLMRDVFQKTLESSEKSSLHEQMEAFKQILIHDMNEKKFADVYAQTIAYGLFTARLHDKTLENFSRQEARDLIPRSNPFLRKLFDYVCGADLDDRVVWIVDALCEVYRAANVHDILHDFGRTTGRNDPIVHFYETFLAEYDPKLRKARGVWYTPEPVVNFIVRAVDDVLQTHFNLPDGLADTSKVTVDIDVIDNKVKGGIRKEKQTVHKVQLLDVAAGTGTFTAEAIKQIHQRFQGQQGMWSGYVEEHLLPRLHGFEILMASYAMCHLKIDLLLTELGYKPTKPANPPRLGVYLTNALEEYHPDTGTLFASWLAHEANEASRIKRDMPIMVAYGNPPYSGISSNNGEWIANKIEDYKYIDGKHFGERKHWLQDDYVKFIRLAEDYIERNGEGVLAYISNHGYLDNTTFRGMRWHLLQTFDDIYILDLHGNTNKNEVAPDGSVDMNVFDIQVGVCIIIAVKHGNRKNKIAQLHHAEIWGDRQGKYETLWGSNISQMSWARIESKAPYYFFVPKDFGGDLVYSYGFSISELMSSNVTGIVTMGDEFIIQESKNQLRNNLDYLLNNCPTELEMKQKFSLGKNYSGWVLENKKKIVIDEKKYVQIDYRPFDKRWTYFDNKLIWRWREQVMKHMLAKENFGLISSRQSAVNSWGNVSIVSGIADDSYVSNRTKERSYCFPLYLYPTESAQAELRESHQHQVRKPNLDEKIVAEIAAKLKIPFVPDHELKDATDRSKFSPLDLLDYIYAVLHSPKYRETYKEFLKIDFPRIPYPENAETFWKLASLGSEIRKFHLLEHPSLAKPITTFPEAGDCVVEKPEYKNGNVYINKTQYFGSVPEVAWNFYIGGYQPAQKWLKDRKGRVLTSDDLRHYQKIIVALNNTDKLMKNINDINI